MMKTDVLTPAQKRAVIELLAIVTERDGVGPLDEAARLQLEASAAQEGTWHLLAHSSDQQLVGYVSILPDSTVQGMVHPDHRRRGHGTHLVEIMRSLANVPKVWVHGQDGPGEAFLRGRGFEPVRTLLTMRREFAEAGADAPPSLVTPASHRPVTFSTFDEDVAATLDELVRVNAAAFEGHPEQGKLTAADFDKRMSQPWFDPADVHLARAGEELAGFVWIKREADDDAEIYVVGVAPEFEGQRIATALITRALRALASSGTRGVKLYVEGDHDRAVGLYTKLGFAVVGQDRQFADTQGGPRAEPSSATRPIPALLPTDEYPNQPVSPRSTRAADTGLARPPRIDVPASALGSNDSGLPPDRFLDRELSWLAFNQRVKDMAEDDGMPLLERLGFCAIFASNLDEFFMVRVAGLKRRLETGLAHTGASGIPPRQVLDLVRQRSHALQADQARLVTDVLLPELYETAGIEILRWDELSDGSKEILSDFFASEVFPVLTPLAVDPAHPFPYISGLALNLVVQLRPRRESRTTPDTSFAAFGEEQLRVARVKVPSTLPRFIRLSSAEGNDPEHPIAACFVPLEDIIAANLGELFPGMDIISAAPFRVTRNEDLEVEEDDAENLLHALERELLRRRFGAPVRLEVAAEVDPEVRDWLVRELGVSESEVFELQGPLDHTALREIAGIDAPALRFRPFMSRTNRHINEVEAAQTSDIFSAIRKRDILLHHPYDSFSTSVQAFVEQAAADPRVQAIKQTLYRTSGDSPLVDALIDAAEAGKQVLALVEIKARFDEENNISWARKLEQAGVHVVYGIVGLKTHCKLSMVVRQEAGGLRRYCHVGTGNYHPKTARVYEDYGLLTCDEQVGEDITRLFNQLSGYAPATTFKRLLVAPRNVRDGLLELIEREAEHARSGRPARIRIKCNSMVDEAIIDGLYRASQAGVRVDIVVRGICALRPGVPGLSDNIRVRSILGRFLEHSRVFAFDNGGERTVYIGSADMMHRNLDRRVEALVRIDNHAHQTQLMEAIELQLDEHTQSWHLGPEGEWERHYLDARGERLVDAQERLIDVHRAMQKRR